MPWCSLSIICSLVRDLAKSCEKTRAKAKLGTAGPLSAYANRMKSGELLRQLGCVYIMLKPFAGDYHKREEPLFQVDLARKDARHMLALSKEHGVEMGPVKTIDKHFEGVKEHMGERGDIAGIYGAIRKEAGLPFEN
jgi:hypothetical protein